MKTELNNIPSFKSENEERKFWSNEDSSEYLNWDDRKVTSSLKLKPSMKTISSRIPEMILIEFWMNANNRDVLYQSVIKVFLRIS